MKNQETTAIEQDFPDWAVWQSQRGVCWAATLRVPAKGIDRTVIMDSAGELREALTVQSRLLARARQDPNRPGASPPPGRRIAPPASPPDQPQSGTEA